MTPVLWSSSWCGINKYCQHKACSKTRCLCILHFEHVVQNSCIEWRAVLLSWHGNVYNSALTSIWRDLTSMCIFTYRYCLS